MFSNLSPKTLTRSFAIQGVKTKKSDDPNSILPVFTVSSRRTITDKRIEILQQGPIDTLDIVQTKQDTDIPEDYYAALVKFEIHTDFWMGFGRIKLADTALLLYPPTEKIEKTGWEETGKQLCPVIEFSTYKLTHKGNQQLD